MSKTSIFANKETQQNSFISECGLTPEEAKRFKDNPNKFINEEVCSDDFEMSGECRALLNGDADKSFWWGLKAALVSLVVIMAVCYLIVFK